MSDTMVSDTDWKLLFLQLDQSQSQVPGNIAPSLDWGGGELLTANMNGAPLACDFTSQPRYNNDTVSKFFERLPDEPLSLVG